MVATEACRRATCDSRAIVTRSRKRRCTRVLMVRRNHVAAAEMPRAIAAPRSNTMLFWRTPSPRSLSHRASSESGSAASIDRPNAQNMRLGSCRKPSLHSRHIDENAGGSFSTGAVFAASGEDFIHDALLILAGVEALGLELEHRAVAAAEGDQFGVGAELDDPAAFQHADAVGVTHR